VHEFAVDANGLPEDTKLVAVRIVCEGKLVQLTFESSEFEDVPDGEEASNVLPITMMKTNYQATLFAISKGESVKNGLTIIADREELREWAKQTLLSAAIFTGKVN